MTLTLTFTDGVQRTERGVSGVASTVEGTTMRVTWIYDGGAPGNAGNVKRFEALK